MRRDTLGHLLPCLLLAVAIVAVALLAGCGGNSTPAWGTGVVAMHILWPAAAGPGQIRPAVIPNATQCLQVHLTHGAWERFVTVKRPVGDTTSDVSITDVPNGDTHLHLSAWSSYTEDPDGTVHATGDMLAWAVTDVVVKPNRTAPVNVSLSTAPSEIVVTSGEANPVVSVDSTLPLTATAYDSEGNILLVGSFAWDSNAKPIATVDTSGVVTGVFPGLATISATAGGITGTLDVHVRGWELWDQAPAEGTYNTVVCNGKIYCFGPVVYQPYGTATWYVYTPGTKTWQQAPDLPTTRCRPTLGVINGKIYMYEGVAGTAEHTFEIDPNTLSVADKATPGIVASAAAGTAFDGKLWVIGGSAYPSTLLRAVQVFDPATNSWSARNDLPINAPGIGYGGTAAVFGGDLYLAGHANYTGPTSDVYRYNATNDSWSAAASLGTARTEIYLGLTPDRLLAAGGRGTESYWGLTDVEAFDGTNWIPTHPLPENIIAWNSGAMQTVDDYLYVIGGAAGERTFDTVYRLYVGPGGL